MPGTVVIFGAGATKACGGPLTSEILPRAFERQTAIEREQFLPLVEAFLKQNFHLATDVALRKTEDYPPLPLLLSMLDIAIDRRQSLGRDWPSGRLEEVRNALEYIIFAVLTHELAEIESPGVAHKADHYFRFLQTLPSLDDLTVISLNYDIIVDNALLKLTDAFPDYGCDISTAVYNGSHRRSPALQTTRLIKLAALPLLPTAGSRHLREWTAYHQSARRTVSRAEQNRRHTRASLYLPGQPVRRSALPNPGAARDDHSYSYEGLQKSSYCPDLVCRSASAATGRSGAHHRLQPAAR